jgi:hypothetical protein
MGSEDYRRNYDRAFGKSPESTAAPATTDNVFNAHPGSPTLSQLRQVVVHVEDLQALIDESNHRGGAYWTERGLNTIARVKELVAAADFR